MFIHLVYSVFSVNVEVINPDCCSMLIHDNQAKQTDNELQILYHWNYHAYLKAYLYINDKKMII